MSAQYAVGVSAKRSTGTVELANMGGGDRYPLVQKGPIPPRSEYAVRSGYAVCISAKRSYEWWGLLPFSAKMSKPTQ